MRYGFKSTGFEGASGTCGSRMTRSSAFENSSSVRSAWFSSTFFSDKNDSRGFSAVTCTLMRFVSGKTEATTSHCAASRNVSL